MRRTSIRGVVIGIPSAGRAGELLTLDYLERIGVPRERIILSVQSKADLEDYTAAGVCERVRALIYGPARNAAGNRNNLLNAVEQPASLPWNPSVLFWTNLLPCWIPVDVGRSWKPSDD